jgi:hypothetical protein
VKSAKRKIVSLVTLKDGFSSSKAAVTLSGLAKSSFRRWVPRLIPRNREKGEG